MQTILDFIKVVIKLGLMACLFVISLIIVINLFVILSSRSATINQLDSIPESYQDLDVPVLVLGAGVINNEQPSEILRKRLDKVFDIYQNYPNKTFIMSGDHREDNYNEVAVMKDYLIEKGIPSQQIYLDHAGYSTYDSIYRLKHIIQVDQAIIVTQGYHLSRALLLANKLQVDAVGVAADEVPSTRIQRETREIFARLKDFAICYLNYEPQGPEKNYAFTLKYTGDHTDHKENLNRYQEKD